MSGILGGIFDGIGTLFNISSETRKQVEEQKRYEYDKLKTELSNQLPNNLISFMQSQGQNTYGFADYINKMGDSSKLVNMYPYYQDMRNFNYQKELNNITMRREDTAIQRRVNDLINSGLSPLLATGSSASSATFSGGSSPVSTAVQGLYHDPKSTPLNLPNAVNTYYDIKQKQAQTKVMDAQASLVKSQAEKTSVDTALSIANTKKTNQEIKNLQSQNELTLSQANLSRMQFQKIKAETDVLMYNLQLSLNAGIRTTDALNGLYNSALDVVDRLTSTTDRNPIIKAGRRLGSYLGLNSKPVVDYIMRSGALLVNSISNGNSNTVKAPIRYVNQKRKYGVGGLFNFQAPNFTFK